jgi:hypothetical protein
MNDLEDDASSPFHSPSGPTSTRDVMGFFRYVFRMDTASQAEFLNGFQYTALILLPLVGLNQLMQTWIPEVDERKPSYEVVFEILGQVFVMVGGMIVIHRMATYWPSYSGVPFGSFHVTQGALVLLLIVLSLQTKLGEKVALLVDRLGEAWEGRTAAPSAKSTPAAQHGMSPLPPPGTQQPMPDFQSMYASGGAGHSGPPPMASPDPVPANVGAMNAFAW